MTIRRGEATTTDNPSPVETRESARAARERLEREVERLFAEDPPVTRGDARPERGASEAVSRETIQPTSGSPSRERAAVVSRETTPGRIVAVVNQKGGVGKTTTAVNLCASLAVAERRTLLIDLDPQGNATSGVGIAKDGLEANVYDVLVNELPLGEAVIPTQIPYLDLVPATVDLFGAEVELVSAIGREHRLEGALDGVRDRYEWVFVDCPPSLGLLTVNALTAVDSVLIPIQCEYYALEGLSQLLGTIRIVQRKLNPRLAIEGVLLTMYDARLNLARQVEQEAVEYFGDRVYETVIPRNVRLSEAPSFGKPVILYDVLSSGATSYMKLAEELIEKCRPNASGSEKV
jgi:chromosome partitioning protein